MAINFPDAPTLGQVSNGYTWDGEKWVQTGSASLSLIPNANVAINSDFRINQGGYVSAAVLAATVYGHDQWKAGASGGDYSFTQLVSSTQITIASGKSLIQPIEDVRVAGGSYVLTWTGTAQARAGVNTLTPSGSYAASPLLITGQTAGTVMSIEFNAGTLGTVKLERGTIATPFVMPDYASELAACQRYYQVMNMSMTGNYATLGGVNLYSSYPFRTEMRAAPTAIVKTAPTLGNSSGGVPTTITSRDYRVDITSLAVGSFYALGALFHFNARL